MNRLSLDPVETAVVTVMGDVTAPTGTEVLIIESEATLNAALAVPKYTLEVPANFLPCSVTSVPGAPAAGLNARMCRFSKCRDPCELSFSERFPPRTGSFSEPIPPVV